MVIGRRAARKRLPIDGRRLQCRTCVAHLPITTVAERLGIPESVLEPYGKFTAKIRLDLFDRFEKPRGKLVLITAITPTTSGEGKTVTTIGLTQGLVKRGHTRRGRAA